MARAMGVDPSQFVAFCEALTAQTGVPIAQMGGGIYHWPEDVENHLGGAGRAVVDIAGEMEKMFATNFPDLAGPFQQPLPQLREGAEAA